MNIVLSRAPDRAQWWWYIHEIVATQRQRLLRRVMRGILTILLIIAGLGILFNTVLAPSPEAVARVEAENDALAAYTDGDFQSGLNAVEKGLAIVPNDPGLLLIKGVLHESLGEAEAAAQSFEQARQNVDNPHRFLYRAGTTLYQDESTHRSGK